jgi:type III pantothenate kinase
MKLLIDVGNSRLKWALGESDQLTIGEPLESQPSTLAAKLARYWRDIPEPQAILVAHVGSGETGSILRQWLANRWPAPIRFVRSQRVAEGVVNGYSDPGRLGVDRWLALVAARQLQPGPLCVVSAGTAITVDLLDRHGYHHGGLIAPGLGAMYSGLGVLESLGPVAERYEGFFGRDTDAAVSSGVLHATTGLVESALRQARVLLQGEEPELFLTGGDATKLSAHLDAPHRLVPHLVLQGLHLIAERAS